MTGLAPAMLCTLHTLAQYTGCLAFAASAAGLPTGATDGTQACRAIKDTFVHSQAKKTC